jgi:hypothetical protein
MLNQAAKDARSPTSYEVMNFGVGGYNLEAEVEVLKSKVLVFKPDVVVLNLFHNDNELAPGINQFLVENSAGISEAEQIEILRRYIYNHNSLARIFERSILYRSKLYVFLVSRMVDWQKRRQAMLHYPTSGGIEDMRPIYRGFREMLNQKKANNFNLLICIHPNLLFGDFSNDYKFASIADEFNIEYFHMKPYYLRAGVTGEALQIQGRPDDKCHPNKLGHMLVAKALFLEMQKRSFINIH